MQLSTALRIHACFLFLMVAHWSADAAEMYQRSHVNMLGGVVRLGDVVTCKGASDLIAAPLLKLELFPAPSAGKTMRLSRQDLQQLLLLNDVDLNGWKFGGAEQTFIVYKQATDVAEVIPAKVEAATAVEVAPATVAVVANQVSQAAPTPAIQEEVAPPVDAVRLVAAIRPISRGEIVKASDLELILSTDEKMISRGYQNLDEVVGKEAKRLIPANWALDSSYVQKPLVVKRNEQVTIRAKAAGVTVTVSGVAKTDGAVDDVIVVIPDGTRDEILARVTGVRELEVFASGSRY